jgi:hypothetical protein
MTTWKNAASDEGDQNAREKESSSLDPEDRRREVCASACEGIPTEELEKGILLELVAACIRMRDDERVTDILNRLVPPRVTLRPVPDPEPLLESDGIEPELAESEPTEAPAPGDPRRPATEMFRIGMRVRLTEEGAARMPAASASPRGVVTGFSKSPYEVRIARDGRATPERFPAECWESDPDYGDLNASLISGVYAPIGDRPLSRIAGRLPAPGWRRPLRPSD